MSLEIHGPTIQTNAPIPVEHTCDGADRPPALAWSGAPPRTRSFALVVHDPDAPRGDWVHWLLFDVPAETSMLPEGLPSTPVLRDGSRQGTNDFGRVGWGGPCPPRGAAHRYVFDLYALDSVLGLPPGVSRDRLEHAMRGHVLAHAKLVATYARGGSA
ncbi:YbhB/YbcL family Raf kinase inhibitor-like protein [Sandaracinus amylolyticus]|uniref:YbhB/YbcL family Raf kinase inhibitor-like protein n=1 Tax=Sandaracinus amylolyticus TaxID=927083 RepID=UPI001F326A01|nr:YbhB/YbcL family Raf kinase inhibitor-like protein [Sandaracinus amylolyticus]UJR84347.1 Hypothetical protein I5071_64260 [Sandaracinus amylolyticus]